MARKSKQGARYGIGEWYGRRLEAIPAFDRLRYARISGINQEICPHRPDENRCNKSGGVCSLASYNRNESGTVALDPGIPDLVTLCPIRFWQDYTIFREVGRHILGTERPVLIKEIGFLQSINKARKVSREKVGRIDMVLARTNAEDAIEDWCALEMQAVYFSGPRHEI